MVSEKSDAALVEFMKELRGIGGARPITDEELATAKDQVLDGLRRMPGIEAPEPEGGMYAFFRIEGLTDSVALAKDMIDKVALGLAPGSAFGPEGQGWLRWCFAQRPETNAAGLERLGQYLKA